MEICRSEHFWGSLGEGCGKVEKRALFWGGAGELGGGHFRLGEGKIGGSAAGEPRSARSGQIGRGGRRGLRGRSGGARGGARGEEFCTLLGAYTPPAAFFLGVSLPQRLSGLREEFVKKRVFFEKIAAGGV